MRSRGLLAGRLAVKIEICTDSSMRGGGRVWRGRRGWAWKCSGPKIGEPNLPRIEFDEQSLLVFFLRPRSSFSPFIRSLILLSSCLSFSPSLFTDRYKMIYMRYIIRKEDQKCTYETENILYLSYCTRHVIFIIIIYIFLKTK